MGNQQRVPGYRLHRPSGRAVVTLNGKDHYLGKHGTRDSRTAYDRAIAEYLARGRELAPVADEVVTVARLALLYYRHVERTHSERVAVNVRSALRHLRRLYGDTAAADFGPKALRRVQASMIEADLSRSTVAAYIKILRRAFRWAATEELLPAEVAYKVSLPNEAMRDDMRTARQAAPVPPVADDLVNRTLPHLPAVVADLVRVLRLSGARPSEVCGLSAGMLDTTGPLWVATLTAHKTAWRGKTRTLVFGPKAQAVLRPYLATAHDLAAPLFSPRAAVAASGKDGAWCGDRYTEGTLRQAVHNACARGGIPPWNPGQVRHTAATEVRKRFGSEHASAMLGHADLNTTLIYAEGQTEIARRVAEAMG